MNSLIQDVRLAGRVLLKHRLVTLVAIVSLALAIAGNTTVFSLVSAFMFRTLPVEPERLVNLFQTITAQANDRTFVSSANFVDWRERSRSFDELAAMRPGRFNLTGGDEPEPVRGVEVTANMFHLLRVEAAIGRTFRPEEEQPGRNEVAVVSYQFWDTRFGSDPCLHVVSAYDQSWSDAALSKAIRYLSIRATVDCAHPPHADHADSYGSKFLCQLNCSFHNADIKVLPFCFLWQTYTTQPA